MPCIIGYNATIFNTILILFSVYIFCQTKIAATHCAAASCGLRPLLCALFCNKLTLGDGKFYYQLEDVDYNGKITLRGPVDNGKKMKRSRQKGETTVYPCATD